MRRVESENVRLHPDAADDANIFAERLIPQGPGLRRVVTNGQLRCRNKTRTTLRFEAARCPIFLPLSSSFSADLPTKRPVPLGFSRRDGRPAFDAPTAATPRLGRMAAKPSPMSAPPAASRRR